MNSDQLNELSKQIHSPVPFWFLNGHVEEWHIVREFEMMSEKGVGEVIVHPRYGLQCEYLSDEWFKIFGWCVREAKKHGMCVWIYDELNWPSGTAGMSVQCIDPEFRGKYLAVEQTPLREIDFKTFQPGTYMVAANIDGGRVSKTRVVEHIDALAGLTGDWQIFNCTLGHDPYYIDTLSTDAVNCFKQVTYDEYYKRFGDEFGGAVRAVFTDEPSVYWVSVGYDDWKLPYTTDYFSTFKERFGYDPVPMIPYLFYPGKEGTGFRADYWDHAGYLFNQRYHGNLGGWCREHGVIYTGHNNHEEPLRYQIRFQGDMFGTMRQEDIPGVDHLGKQTLGNNWISIIGHKICSSSAHFTGKARCMSESFGVMEWDTTYTNLKRVTDWQYAQGINLLIPHAIYHTISGFTKRESPPSFFYQSPHWDDFGYFSDYLKRLEEMLCGGRHNCKVAIMYPLSGLWASYQTDRKTPEFEHIDNFLDSLCLEMIKHQVDFDILDFRALREGELADGKILLADEAYSVLIVPSTPYLRNAEVARLTEIVRSGVNTTFFHKAMEPIRNNLPEHLRGASFVRTEELVSFVDILSKELNEDIQITGGGTDEIMAYRREKDGRKITFLLNRSEKHRKVTAMLGDYPDPAIFDQETGTYTRLDGKRAGRRTQVQLRFQPNQSYFIVSGVPDAKPAREYEDEPEPVEVRNLTVQVPFNVASLYHFIYSPSPRPSPAGGGEGEGGDSPAGGVGSSAGANEPTDVDVRVDPRFIPANWDRNPRTFEQYAGTYETHVQIDCDPGAIAMIVDKDFADCEVYVNDTRIELKPCCTGYTQRSALDSRPVFLTDFQDVRADVAALLGKGMNHFRVVSPTKLSEPLRLVGDFHVAIKGKDVVLTERGSANPLSLEMDYPFYSGTVLYKAEFELMRDYSSLVLNLHDVHDSATVRVNGQPAGKRLWAPYSLDIAGLVRQGPNTLEIEVRNNMANLIYGSPRPLGLEHVPTLAGFQ